MSNKELALLRTLQQKDFYDQNKGTRCPDKLFSKDVRKIKQILDYAMQKYDTDISTSELESLFFTHNTTLTTANKVVYEGLFRSLANEKPMNIKIANEVLSRMFQSLVGEEIATLGFEYINGTLKSLEPLRKLLTKYSDDFLPNFEIEWDNIDIPHLLEMSELESKWKFNIPSLRNRVEGISGGHLIFIGARPNTGKTSSHAYLLAGPGGFAEQGAKCIVLTNEESYHRVGSRYACAGTNMTLEEIKADRDNAMNIYKKVRRNVEIKDASGEDMDYVELAAMRYRPDILVLDMGDKFASKSSDRTDLYLRDAAIHARNIAKKYNCAIFWMSQLSAEAEGKIVPNMSMMEGSKTGKAAEADLMLLISRNTVVEGKDDEDPQRHITVAKNKLSGWHGVIHCELDAKRVQFNA